MSKRGETKRLAIVEAAAQLASHSGLRGASLSQIAERVGLTKSGLVAHFASKEDLTLAVIDHAAHVFGEEVLRGIDHAQPSTARLMQMLERYSRYVIDEIFEGGCLFLTMTAEIDVASERERERVVTYMQVWKEWIERVVTVGQASGELAAEHEVESVSSVLLALCLGMGPTSRLFGAPRYFDHGLAACKVFIDSLQAPR